MTRVQLCINNEIVHSYQFYDLLDGLVYIYRNNIEFDTMYVNDDTIVRKCEFRRYLSTMNNFYKRMYGTCYEELGV